MAPFLNAVIAESFRASSAVKPFRCMLIEDLKNHHQQFQSIKLDAQDLLANLTDIQFTWQPDLDRWSIAQCIDHLLVTGNNSLSNIRIAITEARSKCQFSEGPFRYGIIERWFVRQMEPPARLRFKAPKAYLPSGQLHYAEMVRDFVILQDQFLRVIQDVQGIDLSKVKVRNPVTRWFRLSLGQEIAFNAAHERRHLTQAMAIKREPEFARLRVGEDR